MSESTQTSSSEHNDTAPSMRRKKATRACFHCQKAHLTCDDSRPCQRCIKRDLAATCTDGIRKKAKYLQDSHYDAYEIIDHKFYCNNPTPAPIEQQSTKHQFPPTPVLTHPPTPLQQTHPGPMTTYHENTISPSLININRQLTLPKTVDESLYLKSLGHSIPTSPISPLSPLSSHFADDYNYQQLFYSRQHRSHYIHNLGHSTFTASPQTNQTVFMHNGFQSTPNNIVDPSTLFGPESYPLATVNYGFGSEAVNLEYSILSTMLSSASTESLGPHNGFADIGMIDQNWQQQPQLQRTTSPVITTPGGMNGGSTSQKRENLGKKKMSSNTPENVYANVKTPFSYTEGFHYLVNWVKERMEKEHIERIVRALATFRPSFIALIMNLTEEDLIFMEKCFQRTILEFEKLISFSGTPTVVWRRTGEIALVGKEFLLLTQWTKDQLLGKTTYIYEVMDNQSAVEYWEKFAAHAFDNSRQSVMTTCILMRPSGLPVPCAFCFTIKRDIFDIPLAIVGNFLPILS
ncbi:putative pas domain protein [Gigaspora margarita]|uniref:Putative pas domain protein n=2 Tax=Gigaspora margarita TaxID=4874 RepID=A0A8H4EQC3_GIGMA|nr:putative pas domain protein [Gigaspora margarita]